MSVNTFHKWIKFLFVHELKKLHFISLFAILKISFLRLIKTITHTQMKFKILKLSENLMDEESVEHFIDILSPYIHKTILNNMRDSSANTLLATAAPLFYAKSIQKRYHFDEIIATPYTNKENWKENIKQEKKNNYIELIHRLHWRPLEIILYTDHHDDLPLMRISNLTYLVQPSQTTLKIALKEKIPFKTIV